MAAPRTLKVVTSLRDAGIEIWTPVVERQRRAPRSKKKAEGTVPHPIAPTFAFARAVHIEELRAIRRDPLSPHPDFSLLQHRGEVVQIRDSDLAGLRVSQEVEQRKAGSIRKDRAQPLDVGAEVKMTDGPFTSMSGVVVSSDGRRTFLNFGGMLGRVEIATSNLSEIGLEAPVLTPARKQAPAALAA
ncbi:hypothetical protein KZ810_13075 [Sphingomonas sp. RHCKR47]|uniref:hypothetical protein n=1 Tax=Sphingomonas citricola TaxID=2862498 RepID=UPI001CA47B0E|nr:hypothetical protein [Sphingomonas citricola]MBW6524434.1 hypothetical protein [Sphingomonas citricola]